MMEKQESGVQYDAIALDYAELAPNAPFNKLAVYPSLLEAAGDLRGKDVLDLACGAGVVAQKVKELGAAHVVGVDESTGMLRLAKQKNQELGLDIEYVRGHVGSLGKIGEFDIGTGGFFLHYAHTKEELYAMCRDVASNLKQGGLFVAVNNNPSRPLTRTDQYENRVVAKGPLNEGDDIEVTYESGGKTLSFKQRFWKKETYEHALQEAGLVDIEWLPVVPTKEGRDAMGDEYWQDFLEHPFLILIRARKAAESSSMLSA